MKTKCFGYRYKLFAITVAFSLVLTCLPLGAVNATADTGEVKAAVTVGTMISTSVCPQYSSVSINVTEILADVTQKALITVVTKNCNQQAVPNSGVELTSNRGAIDSIDQVDANGSLIKRGDGLGLTGTSDGNGYTFFHVYSVVPGEALFSSVVDDQITLGQVKCTFLTPPVPKNISIAIEVPKIISPNGKITLFQPKSQDFDPQKLVNLGFELLLPAWISELTAALILLVFIFVIWTIILLLRIGHLQKKTYKELEVETAIVKDEEKELKELTKK
jgi:hypothetical protein